MFALRQTFVRSLIKPQTLHKDKAVRYVTDRILNNKKPYDGSLMILLNVKYKQGQ